MYHKKLKGFNYNLKHVEILRMYACLALEIIHTDLFIERWFIVFYVKLYSLDISKSYYILEFCINFIRKTNRDLHKHSCSSSQAQEFVGRYLAI
jgi:hypothetical protein